MVGINTPQKSQTLQTLRLQRVVEEHRIVDRALGFDLVAPEEEGNVIESILEDFGDCAILKNRTYKAPTVSFIVRSVPITSACVAIVMDRYNERKVSSGSKSNACNLGPTCFNIHRE